MIRLFHTSCPKCRILEAKLKSKNIQYEECKDIDTMLEMGILSVPQLEVDGELLDFAKANQWINERNS
jgi:predicted thioredoxin/glutaredoxin